MTRTLALVILAGLGWGCGSKSLDIGGPAGGDDDGGLSDSGPAAPNSTPIITHQRNATSLFSEGSYLYWTTYDETAGDSAYEIWRCDKHDCAGTRRSLFHTGTPGNLVIRGGRAYFRLDGGIVSCPVDDCTTPTVIIRPASGPPSLVDETNVYWGSLADSAILACPITGCDKPAAPVTGVGAFIGLAADETQLYWILWAPPRTYEILSAPKDGSGARKTLVGGLTKPTSLIAQDGFVYWTEMLSSGYLARCATTGCPGGAEILASEQYHPHYPALDHGALFWLNESAPANQLNNVSRPAKILSCVLPNCATSIELLDEANGGSRWDPIHTFLGGSTMVADEEAIYYLGDVATVGQSDAQGIVVDASIRRLMRRPGR